jgi:replication factor C subunit 2/4
MKKNNNVIWFEKYRPKTINTIIDQEKIKEFLTGAVIEQNIPHLLLHGPPGTGKTSAISILVRKLFRYKREDFPNLNDREFAEENNKLYKNRTLELNVSNERGLKLLRGCIKNFAELAINRGDLDKNIAPFKIIILDEVDVMSHDAQDGLRRVMEDYSKNTRFILICNEVAKIYPPLLSRCTRFAFSPIDIEHSKMIINKILLAEGYKDVHIADEHFQYIYNYTLGDLRKTITIIQQLCNVADIYNLTIDMIREIVGEIPQILINEIVMLLSRPLEASVQEEIYNKCENIISEGYDCLFLIGHLFQYYLNSEISDKKKAAIFAKLALIDNRLNNFSSEFIQILDLMISINLIINS